MRLTRSTKDRKKGCAYDPGALNKQVALKNQTLWYVGDWKWLDRMSKALSSGASVCMYVCVCACVCMCVCVCVYTLRGRGRREGGGGCEVQYVTQC